MAVSPIPEGYTEVTPYLTVRGAARAIEYYQKVFGATEVMRLPMPDGKLAHAEIKIGKAFVMLADEHPEFGNRSPESLGGTPVKIAIYVNDVDAVAKRAVEAGGKMLIPVADQFYGDRSGRLQDPFGHVWLIATHKEDVPPEAMTQRIKEWIEKQAAGKKS